MRQPRRPTTRNFATAQRWREHHAREAIEAWQASGAELDDFAATHGIESARFHRWCARLGVDVALARPALLPVRITRAEHGERAPLEIVLVNERRIRVPPSFDAAELARVLRVVEEA